MCGALAVAEPEAAYISSGEMNMMARRNVHWLILESVFSETLTWLRAKVSPGASVAIGRILREEHRYRNLSEEDDAE